MLQSVEIHKEFKELCENTLNGIKSRVETLKENDSVLGDKTDIETRISKIQVLNLNHFTLSNYDLSFSTSITLNFYLNDKRKVKTSSQ